MTIIIANNIGFHGRKTILLRKSIYSNTSDKKMMSLNFSNIATILFIMLTTSIGKVILAFAIGKYSLVLSKFYVYLIIIDFKNSYKIDNSSKQIISTLG